MNDGNGRMAGEGLTYAEATAFWKKAKVNLGSKVPKAVKETCEIAALGAGLLVASRFTESTLLLCLYWSLIGSFALRIAARIAFPTHYDSPSLPILLGLALTVGVTVLEHLAIQSVADAALIQLQGDKALRLLGAQRRKKIEGERLFNEAAKAGCINDEQIVLDQNTKAKCDRLRIQRYENDHSTDHILQP